MKPTPSPEGASHVHPVLSALNNSFDKDSSNRVRLKIEQHLRNFTTHSIDDLKTGLNVCSNCKISSVICNRVAEQSMHFDMKCSVLNYLRSAIELIDNKDIRTVEKEVFLKEVEVFLDKVLEIKPIHQ